MATKIKDKNKSTAAETSGSAPKKCNILCWILVPALVLFLAAVSYKGYQTLIMVPEMPEIELNKWWGPRSSRADLSIRPYRIVFSDSMLENIRRKFESYRSMTKVKSLNETSSYGLNSEVVAQIFAHWQFQYKYRQRIRYLNKFDHFKTNIQGLDIHFVHVKPKAGPNIKVVPILLLHGWPTSVREFYEVIPTLTSENLDYDFVFEVIAPSLPGFIYSQAPIRPGLSGYEMAILMRNLMERLGFKKFFVHGGDIGHIIGSHMATIFPNQILGFHTSFPINFDKTAQLAWAAGEIFQNVGNNKQPFTDKLANFLEETGYLHLQFTKPDTIGTVLQDSPVGLAAYIVDRIFAFTDPINKELPDVGLSAFNTTYLIDNVMLYWSSGSITTSLRLFKENIMNCEIEHTLASIPTIVPTWGLRAKNDLIHQSDSILQWKYKNLVGTTNLDVGGHFPALEIPDKVASNIFKAVKSFLNLSEQK